MAEGKHPLLLRTSSFVNGEESGKKPTALCSFPRGQHPSHRQGERAIAEPIRATETKSLGVTPKYTDEREAYHPSKLSSSTSLIRCFLLTPARDFMRCYVLLFEDHKSESYIRVPHLMEERAIKCSTGTYSVSCFS